MNNINKKIEIKKNKQTEIQDSKSTLKEMESSLEGFNNRFQQA